MPDIILRLPGAGLAVDLALPGVGTVQTLRLQEGTQVQISLGLSLTAVATVGQPSYRPQLDFAAGEAGFDLDFTNNLAGPAWRPFRDFAQGEAGFDLDLTRNEV